jgi:short-subunit dehydrogenase involved in D-alanine esterification of teichoic acids
MKAKYPKLHVIQSDVANPADIATLAARVKADFPKLDVLMNNAGIMLHKNPARGGCERRDCGGPLTRPNITREK